MLASRATSSRRTSDVHGWAPGGFVIVHPAFGTIGGRAVGGVEIIGVDDEGYRSTFYDSFGNVHGSRVEIEGDVLRGSGTGRGAPCRSGGTAQVTHHESSVDGVCWM